MTRLPIFPALLVAFSLVGQEAPKADAAGPATKLTLQSAIETSLKNNLQVQIAVETRDFTRAGLMIEQGAFDWNVTGNVSLSRIQNKGTRQGFVGGPLLTTETTASAAT